MYVLLNRYGLKQNEETIIGFLFYCNCNVNYSLSYTYLEQDVTRY